MTRDSFLHEVATTLRDLTLAVHLWEQADTLGWESVSERKTALVELADAAEAVLDAVVEREGDIISTFIRRARPGAGP